MGIAYTKPSRAEPATYCNWQILHRSETLLAHQLPQKLGVESSPVIGLRRGQY